MNLGIGMPTECCNFISPDQNITLQTENGILRCGGDPEPGQEDPDYINASFSPTTVLPGGSTFSGSESYGMLRGGHVDLTVLGALEVSASGDLASWIIPGQMVKGIGGAMDLVATTPEVVACLSHTSKDGSSKIVESCSLPLTGKGVVNVIITELAVFEVSKTEGLVLIEHAEGVTVEDIRKKTAAAFKVSDHLRPMLQ